MRIIALLASLIAFTACEKQQCLDCTIFERAALGTVQGEPGYIPRFDRDSNKTIDVLDYQAYLEDCSL